MTARENILCSISSTSASAFDACTAYKHHEMRAGETLTELIPSDKIPALIALGVDNGSDAIGGGDDGTTRTGIFPYADPYNPHTIDPVGSLFPHFWRPMSCPLSPRGTPS